MSLLHKIYSEKIFWAGLINCQITKPIQKFIYYSIETSTWYGPYLSRNGCNSVQYSMHQQQLMFWKDHVKTPPHLTSAVLLAIIGILFAHQIRIHALLKPLPEDCFRFPIFLKDILHVQQVLHKPKDYNHKNFTF